MRTGTSHFKSMGAALAYYRKQCGGESLATTAGDIKRKIDAGEIAIGRPEIPTGCELGCDDDGRYWIDELGREERALARQRAFDEGARLVRQQGDTMESKEPIESKKARLAEYRKSYRRAKDAFPTACVNFVLAKENVEAAHKVANAAEDRCKNLRDEMGSLEDTIQQLSHEIGEG